MLREKRSVWLCSGIALATVAIVLAIKLLLKPLLVIESPFLLFLAAIMVSAWYGGRLAGLIATVFSVLAIGLVWMSPTEAVDVLGYSLRMALFVAEGLLISIVISSLHRAEKHADASIRSLTEREKQFRQLAENIHEVFWMAEPFTSQLIYISPAYDEIWGRSRHQLYEQPKRFFDAIHPDDREQAIAIINRQMQGEAIATEYRIVRPDGSIRWIWNRSFPIHNASGQTYRVTGIAEDISDRRAAETLLRQSEERYRAFIEQSSEGIWRLELETPLPIQWSEAEQIQHLYEHSYIAECNHATAQMYGFISATELIGKRVKDFFDRTNPISAEHLRQFIRSGYRLSGNESSQSNPHGQTRYFLNTFVGIIEQGQLVRIWGSQRDITEQKRNQAILAMQNRVLEMIATGVPLPDVLDVLARSIETQLNDGICSILLLNHDRSHLHIAAAPHLPDAMKQIATEGIPIAPTGRGSCSAAVHQQSLVVATDIAQDHLWDCYRDAVLQDGWHASWSTPIFASTGEILGTFGMYYRVSRQPSQHDQHLIELSSHLAGVAIERQRSEAALNHLLLREQQARAEVEVQRTYLHSLLMQAPALICIHRGREHVFEFANTVYRQVVGNRELIGKPVRDVFPELADQGFFELLDQVYTTGKPYLGKEIPAKFNRGNGVLEEGFFNFVYQPMYGADGSVAGVMTFAFDVTDHVLSRQQAEVLAKYLRSQQRALKESEERYRSLIEATSQIVWCTKAEGEFIEDQPAWGEFTGQTSAELKGWGWLNAVHPDDQSHTASAWIASVATRSLYEVEHRLRRYDGEYRYMSVRAIPITEPDGSIREWIGVHTDITDRKRAEAERELLLTREQAARAEAEAANRMKDEFLATLSHELRTPLNAMLGWTQLLRTRKFDESTAARALETIDRNSRTLAQLIEDVLDVSRIITGKLRLNIQPVQLSIIIGAAIDTLRPAADTKHLQVNFTAPSNPITVSGDASRLQQVVWNLLSNAIKFTPEQGQVNVSLSLISHHQLGSIGSQAASDLDQMVDDTYAQITVSDTGQGINSDFLPHVFDRFRQADGSITRMHSGLGLGLAIVRHLVELHGGTVRAESAGEGQGATFMVNLPIVAATIDRNNDLQPLDSEPDGHAPLQGINVLVVDDEADARELLTVALRQYGADVIATASSAEALSAMNATIPDVLISDIGMPEEDGYTLIRHIRSQNQEIPAIALTAYARTEDRVRAYEAGFQRHIPKPVRPNELAIIVADLTGRKVE